jgi:hypothetical protein
MVDPIESPQWQADAVVKRLQERTSGGQPVSVQVFMSEKIKPGEISSIADEIVRNAAEKSGLPSHAVRVGKVFPLARSFSVIADKPETFRAIADNEDVKSILESEQADILPKPLNRTLDL